MRYELLPSAIFSSDLSDTATSAVWNLTCNSYACHSWEARYTHIHLKSKLHSTCRHSLRCDYLKRGHCVDSVFWTGLLSMHTIEEWKIQLWWTVCCLVSHFSCVVSGCSFQVSNMLVNFSPGWALQSSWRVLTQYMLTRITLRCDAPLATLKMKVQNGARNMLVTIFTCGRSHV